MNATVIRNAIVAIFMALLCILVGSYAAEDKNIPIFMLAGILGLIFMLVMGRKSWMLLYFLPPLIPFLPLGILERLPAAFLVAGFVLAYWAVMWIMGYVRFKWRWLPAMDLLALIVFVYYLLTFYWHPVSINSLGIDAEYVGGKEYIWFLLAYVYYVTISCIPCTYDDLYGVLRKTLYVMVGVSIFSSLLSVFGIMSAGGLQGVGEEMGNSRFSMFSALGVLLFLIVFSKKPFHEILTSPKAILALMFCCAAVVISGWREKLVSFGILVFALCYIKREMVYLIFLVAMAYGSLLYLSEEKVVKDYFPYGMQRTLSVFPGVEIKEEVRSETEHSSEWRKVMWRWALDPRTGYIKDYIWGDGFGQAVSELNRYNVSLMRGTTRFGDQEDFAQAGVWHNGAIVALHRTGIVGLALIVIMDLYVMFMIVRVCRAYRGTPMFLLSVVFLCSFFGDAALCFISAGGITHFFTGFVCFGLTKVLYCAGREEGIIVPVFSQGRYKPMLIAEAQRNELIQHAQQDNIALRHRRG